MVILIANMVTATGSALFRLMRFVPIQTVMLALILLLGWYLYSSQPEPYPVGPELLEKADRIVRQMAEEIPAPAEKDSNKLLIDHFEGDILVDQTDNYLVRHRLRQAIRSQNRWQVPDEQELPWLGKLSNNRSPLSAEQREEMIEEWGAEAVLTGNVVARDLKSPHPLLKIDLELQDPKGQVLWSRSIDTEKSVSGNRSEAIFSDRIGKVLARLLLINLVILMTPVVLFRLLQGILNQQSNTWNLMALLTLTAGDCLLAWQLVPLTGSWLWVVVLLETGLGFYWNGYCLDRWEQMRVQS